MTNHPSNKYNPDDKPQKPFGRNKRNNNGFKVSAAAMFNGQTGGKGSFTDYT